MVLQYLYLALIFAPAAMFNNCICPIPLTDAEVAQSGTNSQSQISQMANGKWQMPGGNPKYEFRPSSAMGYGGWKIRPAFAVCFGAACPPTFDFGGARTNSNVGRG